MPFDALRHIIDATRAKPCGLDCWLGHCIAHGSRNHPDLSIRRTNRLILLHDFGGCTFHEICEALVIHPRDLFFDAPLRRDSHPIQKVPRVDLQRIAFRFEMHAMFLMDRAQERLNARNTMDVSEWSDSDLDSAWNDITEAYHDQERAGLLFNLTDQLRVRAYEETNR